MEAQDKLQAALTPSVSTCSQPMSSSLFRFNHHNSKTSVFGDRVPLGANDYCRSMSSAVRTHHHLVPR